MSALEDEIIKQATVLLKLIKPDLTESQVLNFVKNSDKPAITETEPQWITTKKACEILDCSLPTCYNLINNGDLRHRNLCGKQRRQLRVLLSDVLKPESIK